MRIAWCSPLSKRSGVSKFSLAVVKALQEVAEVDWWCESTEDNFDVDFAAVFELNESEACIDNIRQYDAVVYNLGNNVEHHYRIHWLYTRLKGVVILHDKFMHHFYAGHYLVRMESLTAYAMAMRHYYGTAAKDMALKSLRRPLPVWETDEVEKYPLFEPSFWNSAGVVVHSRDALNTVRRRLGPSPSAVLQHPFYIENYEYGDAPLLSRRELGLPDDRLILLSHGAVNPNKRIDTVLKVLAENDALRHKVSYVVAGGGALPRTMEHLQNLVRRLGLDDTVQFTGYVDDRTMHSYLTHADICLNLRFPSIESSSGSLIEQLYFGKPVVVTRIGSYDELPDNCVVKIDMDDEEGNLSAALERLAADSDYRSEVAAAGYRWAQEHCSAERYAADLMEFVKQTRDGGQVLDFVDGIADTLSEFLHPGLQAEFVSSIAGEIHAITG